MTPISLKLNISKTVRDRRMVEINHIWSYIILLHKTYGHVTDDVACRKWRQFKGEEPLIGTKKGCKILANEG